MPAESQATNEHPTLAVLTETSLLVVTRVQSTERPRKEKFSAEEKVSFVETKLTE
jgi:hypothetical protein